MAMNLGDAKLSQVAANRPQIARADSRQSIAASESIAASDDYYSVSEGGSDDRETVIRYQTPPLRSGSADSGSSQATKKADPMPTHQEVVEPLPTPRTSNQPQRATSRTDKIWQDPHVDASAPTPGLDDSPYIQFAIDQLTRDEEVHGRNRESKDSRLASLPPPVTAATVATASGSVERGPEVSSSKHPSERAEEPIEQPSPALITKRTSLERPIQAPFYENHETSSNKSQLFPPYVPREERARPVLLPAQPRSSDYRYPTLNFVPGPLRLLPILALMVFCTAMIVILVVSTVLGAKNYGLLGYDGVGTARYFLFQYLPQLLAAVVVVWLLVIQAAIQRILPFVLLARSNGYPGEDVLESVPIYITSYLWPNTSLLKQSIALKFCAVIFWLTLFTVPLTSSLYQTRWYSQIANGIFLWTTVQPVSVILIVLYILLIIALVITYIYFNRHTTGLKWDPISLADIIVLLRRTSNLTLSRRSEQSRQSSSRPHSLGYWESTSRPGAIFYGIGAAHTSPLASAEEDSINDPEARVIVQQSTFESWHSNLSKRNHSQPTFLRESLLILYAVTAIILLIAFLVVSYLHSALLGGFVPLLPTATSDTSSFTSFSPSNFLYSFIPSFLGLLLALFWTPVDTAFRYLQPWSTLSKQYPSSASQASGHSAASTLLLSYPSSLPFSTTIRALSHGHLRIAWFSFLSLLSWVIPVLAGGIFTAQFISSSSMSATSQDQSRGGEILIRVDAAALYAITVILILYALSWLLTFPGAKDRAVTGPDGRPVDVRYLAGIRSVVDESVLRESTWKEPRTRIDLVTRLVGGEGPKARASGRWAMIQGRITRT